MPCGAGRHTVGWEAGSLRLPSHPDAEGELVLAALGGEKARCVELAEAWARHAGDLSVLAIGPRGPADEIAVGWDDVARRRPGGAPGPRRSRGRVPGLASPPGPTLARMSARRRQMQEEMLAAHRRRTDMLSLLALGYGFQVRLIGQVAAAHAARPEGSEGVRPALVAAIAGRLAPVAEAWLGIDPDQVVVSLHHGPGWGSAELAGRGQDRRLRVSLPAGWLASVWACGLARVGRHLVVAVEQPGWPDARVLGLRAPGAEPEPLAVHAAPQMSEMTGPRPKGAAPPGDARNDEEGRRCVRAPEASGDERESGGRGARGGGRGRGAGAAVGGTRHRQDVRHPGHGPRHGPALRDGHRLDQGALRLRRAAHRGRRRGAVRSPAWARRLAEAGRGLLFLDELSTAPPAVQAALLRVVLERAVGDLTLPDEVAVVAAANPPEQAADGWDLSAPLANRLCHLSWRAHPRSVADGLAGGWAAPVIPPLPDGWQAEEILARGLVAAFLHVRPALACAPPTDAASAGRGWPSPRTWEMAGRLMAAAGRRAPPTRRVRP